MGKHIGWKQAKTLAETIVQLVRQNKTESPEFKLLLQFFGREKLMTLYREQIKREKERK